MINAGYAFAANLTKKDQIVAEDNTSPYVNIIAVKKGRETDPSIVKYIEIFHTEPVKKFIEDKVQGPGGSRLVISVLSRRETGWYSARRGSSGALFCPVGGFGYIVKGITYTKKPDKR